MIEAAEMGNCLVIRMTRSRLDHAVASTFRLAVLDRAKTSERTVVLDLSAVDFIDSSGLGALMGIRKRLGWSVRIVLAGLRSPVFRVFELARVTSVFTFYTSVEAAVGRATGDDAAWSTA
ncbi:MAG: STAS domain-containing protein [Pseudomonadota bacterium]